jgi:hypothetical protein
LLAAGLADLVGLLAECAAARLLAVVWAGAERANSTANAAAAIALSWVARQVSRDSRRRPLALLSAEGLSIHSVGSPAGSRGSCVSRMGCHHSGPRVKSPPRSTQEAPSGGFDAVYSTEMRVA